MSTERNLRGTDSSKLWARIQAIPQSRFPRTSDYDRKTHAYKKSYVNRDGYPIEVSACTGLIPTPPVGNPRDPGRGDDPPDGPVHPLSHHRQGELRVPTDIVAWRWRLEQVGSGTVDRAENLASSGPNACRARLVAPSVGQYRVHLTLELTDGVETAMRPVRIQRDRLVVSVGDSYASGQGNPDRPRNSNVPGLGNPVWVEPKAHRSFRAGPALAAKDWENRAEGDLVSFLSFATSGAEIEDGLLTPQHPRRGRTWGVGPDGWQTVGQLEEAKRAVGDQSIDVLLISIGGNDIGFASGLRGLALGTKSVDSLTEDVIEKIEGLEEKYDQVAQKVDELDAEHVFITEYPIAHFDSKDDGTVGKGCGTFIQVSRYMAEEIKRLGKRLNQAVEAAATKHGWTLVDGITEDFTGHGYCRSNERYFVTFSESNKNQGNIKGTMHPNAKGQRVYGDRITATLRQEIDEQKERDGRGGRDREPIVRDHRQNTDTRGERGSGPRVRDHRTNRTNQSDDTQQPAVRKRSRNQGHGRQETDDRRGNVHRR